MTDKKPEAQQLGECGVSGMTLREHFASLALQGLLADQTQQGTFSNIAEQSVGFAEALLEELAK